MVRTSVVFAAFCSVLSFCGGLALRRPCRHGCGLVPVVVASVDVPAGAPLTFDMISQRSLPEQCATKRVVKPDSASLVVGLSPHRNLEAGEPLQWDDFPTGLTSRLGDGKRAVVVELEREVHEGDRVDLLQHGDAAPLLENAVALTAGRSPWLRVTADEASALARWGQRRPGFTVVLRGR